METNKQTNEQLNRIKQTNRTADLRSILNYFYNLKLVQNLGINIKTLIFKRLSKLAKYSVTL